MFVSKQVKTTNSNDIFNYKLNKKKNFLFELNIKEKKKQTKKRIYTIYLIPFIYTNDDM
jgi:hypothetical protein